MCYENIETLVSLIIKNEEEEKDVFLKNWSEYEKERQKSMNGNEENKEKPKEKKNDQLGAILIFLPGTSEINQMITILKSI